MPPPVSSGDIVEKASEKVFAVIQKELGNSIIRDAFNKYVDQKQLHSFITTKLSSNKRIENSVISKRDLNQAMLKDFEDTKSMDLLNETKK